LDRPLTIASVMPTTAGIHGRTEFPPAPGRRGRAQASDHPLDYPQDNLWSWIDDGVLPVLKPSSPRFVTNRNEIVTPMP
jgi:hypothetical protein